MGRRRGSSAFPVARIKKMMQSDDDVGKIATVTPVLVAKALELMMEHVLREAAQVATDRHTKTVTPQHLKTCVMANDSFDFLRDLLAAVDPLEDTPRRARRKRPRSPTNALPCPPPAAPDADVRVRDRAQRSHPVRLPQPENGEAAQPPDAAQDDRATASDVRATSSVLHNDEDDDYDDDDADDAPNDTVNTAAAANNNKTSVHALLS